MKKWERYSDTNKISMPYQCGVYLRLSKEDENLSSSIQKSQSNSIENQKQFIEEYIKTNSDMQVARYYADDGYSGINFERPFFQKMLQDIKENQINCVIVKDLSRFGRNYIETGKYIERLFPALGVRFIAINDQYDSADENAPENDLIIPFKNLINDAYCRDISIKIRSHLETKRKKGEFVGAFTVYGYKKGENKNKLAIDNYAGKIVKEIFGMKMNGMSQQTIADELNSLGILSPAEYKKEQGSGYQAFFQKRVMAVWSAVAVSRILKNEVYTGTIVQGKESTPNYKINIREKTPPDQWCRVENTHEGIISQTDFDVIQAVMEKDTRVMDGKKGVSVFSGYLLCADCGNSMVRYKVPSRTMSYVYYRCSGNKVNKNCCSNHRISEKALYETMQRTLHLHMQYLIDSKEQLAYVKAESFLSKKYEILELQIIKKREEVIKYREIKFECYEDYKSGVLSQEEYLLFYKEMESRVKNAQSAISELKRKRDIFLSSQAAKREWVEEFLLFHGADAELTRLLIVLFIDCIYIYEDHRIEVIFSYQDNVMKITNLIKNKTIVYKGVV